MYIQLTITIILLLCFLQLALITVTYWLRPAWLDGVVIIGCTAQAMLSIFTIIHFLQV